MGFTSAKRNAPGTVLALLLALSPCAYSQGGEPEVDLKELARQIRQNMIEVEREIDQAEAKAAGQAGQKAKADLDELIKRLSQRGQQISTDIEELIKNLPP